MPAAICTQECGLHPFGIVFFVGQKCMMPVIPAAARIDFHHGHAAQAGLAYLPMGTTAAESPRPTISIVPEPDV